MPGNAPTVGGFETAHSDWQQLIDDPKVNLIAITTPNHLHFPHGHGSVGGGQAGLL
nr:hypothetical protein GCM10020185_68630 [Pseudomonas brassicacearum subsp. brassicacearum]